MDRELGQVPKPRASKPSGTPSAVGSQLPGARRRGPQAPASRQGAPVPSGAKAAPSAAAKPKRPTPRKAAAQKRKRRLRELAIIFGIALLVVVVLGIMFSGFFRPKGTRLAYEQFGYLPPEGSKADIERAKALYAPNVQIYSSLYPDGDLVAEFSFEIPVVFVYVHNSIAGRSELRVAIYDEVQRRSTSDAVHLYDALTGDELPYGADGQSYGLFYLLAARDIEVELDKANQVLKVNYMALKQDLKSATNAAQNRALSNA